MTNNMHLPGDMVFFPPHEHPILVKGPDGGLSGPLMDGVVEILGHMNARMRREFIQALQEAADQMPATSATTASLN